MESTRTRVEVMIMKPVLLKAGIPLVLSVAGFIYAKIAARRYSISKASSSSKAQENHQESDSRKDFRDDESFHSINSTTFRENESQVVTNTQLIMKSMESFVIRDDEHDYYGEEILGLRRNVQDYGEEILGLRRNVEDLQEREWELERRFLRYHDLKEQESVLLELRHMFLMEIARVEFFEKEVSLVEAGNEMLGNLVLEYLKVLEQLEFWKLENGVLHGKVKKLTRKAKAQSQMIRVKNLEIEGREAEIWKTCEELEKKNGVIIKFADEVKELKCVVHQLQEEKNDLFMQLELGRNVSKIEVECVTLEDYNKLVNEIGQLQTDRAAEVKELIFLRWSNACLKHELMRSREQGLQNQERGNNLELKVEQIEENEECGLEHESNGLGLEQGESCLGIVASNQACSKRGNLMQKFKRWVEKSEKMKGKLDGKERREVKCFGRHSVSDCAEEHLTARKSCSSA